MERDSFVFYRSFYESLLELPPEAQNEVFLAICSYSLDGIEKKDLSGIGKAIFCLIKPQIDANSKRYLNGKNGGRPPKSIEEKTKPKPNQNQTVTKQEPNVNVNVNVNDNDNINIKNNIDNRKLKFSQTLEPFLVKYGKDMLNEFFKYWTEPNKSNSKFRQELEKTWDVSRRLETWANNNSKFKPVSNGTVKQTAEQLLNQRKSDFFNKFDESIENSRG